MFMKGLLIPALIALLSVSCGGEKKPLSSVAPVTSEAPKPSNDAKGIGPIKEVKLTNPLDQAMVAGGKNVYELKCSACHKLGKDRVVGPGWSGVTSRRTPEWIMNFTVNVDEMLGKDPAAMAMLEECLVRMPNQNLTEADARNVLEFMRHNDGVK